MPNRVSINTLAEIFLNDPTVLAESSFPSDTFKKAKATLLDPAAVKYCTFVPKQNSRYEKLSEVTNLLKSVQSTSDAEAIAIRTFYKILVDVVKTPWDGTIYKSLTSIDGVFFRGKLEAALRKIQHLDVEPTYLPSLILILKTVFALKYYLGRIHYQHPMPYEKPESFEEASDDFKRLVALEPVTLRGLTSLDNQRWSSDATLKIGKKACDFFMEKQRMHCSKERLPALSECIKTPILLKRILSYLHTGTAKNSFLATTLSAYVPNEFRPVFVKDLVYSIEQKCRPERFKIRRYFNPTGGWSGRLIGAMSLPNIDYYMETDPNTNLHEIKLSMVRSYSLDAELTEIKDKNTKHIGYTVQKQDFYGPRSYIFYSKPVEDLSLSEIVRNGQFFDLVFYSPPYFQVEKYPDPQQGTQSHVRYPTLEAWIEKFLYKSILQGLLALSEGGFFAINVAAFRLSSGRRIDLPEIVKGNIAKFQYPFYFTHIDTYNFSFSTQYPSPVFIYRKRQASFLNFSVGTLNNHGSYVSMAPQKRLRYMADPNNNREEIEKNSCNSALMILSFLSTTHSAEQAGSYMGRCIIENIETESTQAHRGVH